MDEWIEDGAFLGEDFFGKGGGKESEIGGSSLEISHDSSQFGHFLL